MLTSSLEKLPRVTRSKVNRIFLHIAIAYEAGTDWRKTARFYINRNSGFIKRFAETFANCSEIQLERAVATFFGEL